MHLQQMEGRSKSIPFLFRQNTPGVEAGSVDEEEGVESPREKESKQKELKDTHFESIDVLVTGDDGWYEGTILSLGGSGRSRIATASTLLPSWIICDIEWI